MSNMSQNLRAAANFIEDLPIPEFTAIHVDQADTHFESVGTTIDISIFLEDTSLDQELALMRGITSGDDDWRMTHRSVSADGLDLAGFTHLVDVTIYPSDPDRTDVLTQEA